MNAQTVRDLIAELQTRTWLTIAEHRLQNYANDESWARLGLLLITYQKVVSP